ncbi:MAG: hypothetical protein N2C14_28890, partial [Planctomycetales bacterium]
MRDESDSDPDDPDPYDLPPPSRLERWTASPRALFRWPGRILGFVFISTPVEIYHALRRLLGFIFITAPLGLLRLTGSILKVLFLHLPSASVAATGTVFQLGPRSIGRTLVFLLWRIPSESCRFVGRRILATLDSCRWLLGQMRTSADDQDWWSLILGLPALALLGGAVLLGVFTGGLSDYELMQRYSEQAEAASDSEDFERARLLYERLSQVDRRVAPRFSLALTLQRLSDEHRVQELREAARRESLGMAREGRKSELPLSQKFSLRAVRLMWSLMPPDQPGHGPAHYWYARRLLETDVRSLGASIRHLEAAVAADPNLVEARRLLADQYYALRQYARAEPHYLYLVPYFPKARLKLAKMYAAIGRYDEMKRQAQLASAWFERMTRQEPENLLHPLSLVESLTLQNKYKEAVEKIKEFRARLPEDAVSPSDRQTPMKTVYGRYEARVYFDWAN